MSVKHKFQCNVPASAKPNPAWVGPEDWDDTHVVGLLSTAYSLTGNISADDEVVEATGGSGGITLTLQSLLLTAGKVYEILKVDSGAGAVTLNDSNSALFNGDSSYVLSNQWQRVRLQWNGTRFNVLGGN